MFNPIILLTIICAYIVLLLLSALWTDRKASHKAISKNPVIYAFSFAIYCSAWSFYGNIGEAANSGVLFIATSLGPVIFLILYSGLIKKLVKIKEHYHITSIADLVSARYGQSQTVGAIVTLIIIIGTIPYIALQLKAITGTFTMISHPFSGFSQEQSDSFIGLLMVIIFSLFTVIIGIRKLDPTERHPGMIMAISLESIVKLILFLISAVFIVYFLFDGYEDILNKLDEASVETVIQDKVSFGSSLLTWTAYLSLSFFAIILLPRQFHVAVIENADIKNIKTAVWLFPIYLLLINIFVYPIAGAGILKGYPLTDADNYSILLTINSSSPWISILVFLGGFSAASAMIMISSMTISTMIMNHLLLPALNRFKALTRLKKHLLKFKWVVVFLFILCGYFFEKVLVKDYLLVNIGNISFTAILQFAPAVIGGIIWRKGNKSGALLGILSGFIIWAYTLLLPSFLNSGIADKNILDNAAFSWGFLHPQRLFGIEFPDPIIHAVFWSMLSNILLYVLGSLLLKHSREEQKTADEFVEILSIHHNIKYYQHEEHVEKVIFRDKRPLIEKAIRKYLNREEANNIIDRSLSILDLKDQDEIRIFELAQIINIAEKQLSGYIGSASAHNLFKDTEILSSSEKMELTNAYSEMIRDLRLTPQTLMEKIDYHMEREKLLSNHAKELEDKNTELEQLLYVTSHDLRSPLVNIQGFSRELDNSVQYILDSITKLDIELNDQERFDMVVNENIPIAIKYIISSTAKMDSLLQGLLKLSRVERIKSPIKNIDMNSLVANVIETLSYKIKEENISITIDQLPDCNGDEKQLNQAFTNIIDNSIKYLEPARHGKIHISGFTEEFSNIYCIEDNGIGISKEHQEKIFEIFYRVNTETIKGEGLGLSIVSKIVRRHKGKIWVESVADNGSKFYLSIPKDVS